MKEVNQNMESQIIAAAEKLFLEKGFARTSTTEIAKMAGCNQALVHYYFRTKENLFHKLFEKKFLMVIESIAMDVSGVNGLKDRIESVITRHIAFLKENPELPMLVLSEMSRNKDNLKFVFERMRGSIGKIMSQFDTDIKNERKKGLIRDVNGFDVLFSIISLNIFMFISKTMVMGVREFSEQEYDEFIDKRKEEIIKTIIGGIYL